MRRIVFSISFSRQNWKVQLVFTSTKSRRNFYTQVERQSFHTAWTHFGHGRRSLGTSWALSELWVTPIRCAFLVRTQHETTAIHRSRRKHGGHLAASRSRAAIGASNRFPQ